MKSVASKATIVAMVSMALVMLCDLVRQLEPNWIVFMSVCTSLQPQTQWSEFHWSCNTSQSTSTQQITERTEVRAHLLNLLLSHSNDVNFVWVWLTFYSIVYSSGWWKVHSHYFFAVYIQPFLAAKKLQQSGWFFFWTVMKWYLWWHRILQWPN